MEFYETWKNLKNLNIFIDKDIKPQKFCDKTSNK